MKNKVTLAISTLVLCSSVSVAQAAKHHALTKTGSKHSSAGSHKAEHHASFSHHHATHVHHTLASHSHHHSRHHEFNDYASSGDVRSGVATLYSERLHGRPTASGEPYDMDALTAAHRSLPLNSYVEVTNLENNRKVVVKVNDRGPFHTSHIMDLSTAAAEELGIYGGSSHIKITPVAMNEYAANN